MTNTVFIFIEAL